MRMERELKTEIAAASGTLTEVARRFGVTRTWVSMVRNGRN
jgi:transposase-like protein